MATLANVYGRLMSATRLWEAERETARVEVDNYFLRPIPNEDIAFYVKRIDNSLVVREADPKARSTCWRFIMIACTVAVMAIGLLLPTAYGLLAGYQVEQLKKENDELLSVARTLEIEEARLLTPQRLEELAKMQELVDPAADKVVYLEPAAAEGAVAMNAHAMLPAQKHQ